MAPRRAGLSALPFLWGCRLLARMQDPNVTTDVCRVLALVRKTRRHAKATIPKKRDLLQPISNRVHTGVSRAHGNLDGWVSAMVVCDIGTTLTGHKSLAALH